MVFPLHRLGGVCARLRILTWPTHVRRVQTQPTTVKPQAKLPYETDTNVTKHVEVYRFDNFRHFAVIKVFGLIQLMFWAYLADFSNRYLKDATPPVVKDEGASRWARISAKFTENKYRNGITAICLLLGNVVAVGVALFTLRSVRSVILMKGGEKVYIQTYSPIRNVRGFEVPLSHVSCMQSRLQKSSYISLKVKGHWMYYLIDQRGTFPHPKLFDNTVGTKRTF